MQNSDCKGKHKTIWIPVKTCSVSSIEIITHVTPCLYWRGFTAHRNVQTAFTHTIWKKIFSYFPTFLSFVSI